MIPQDQAARRQLIEALVDRVLAVYRKRHGDLPPVYPRERVRKKVERKLRLLARGKPFAADRLYRACSSAAFGRSASLGKSDFTLSGGGGGSAL